MADTNDVRQSGSAMLRAPDCPPARPAMIVLSDGMVLHGISCGADGEVVGQLCGSTVMAGYQEVMSDPGHAGNVIVFAFPHIGNVGSNAEDMESARAQAAGCILAEPVTAPSSFRAEQGFADWLRTEGTVAVAGVDTRALMQHLRRNGPLRAVLASNAEGKFDVAALQARAKAAETVAAEPSVATEGSAAISWREGNWQLGEGFADSKAAADAPHVVVLDLGARRSLLRALVAAGARVSVLPPSADITAINRLGAAGLVLSGGAGDPAATDHLQPTVRSWLEGGKPLFATGLGMQLLARTLGADTVRLQPGRHGRNHPVRRLSDGAVSVESVNHDFVVRRDTLPQGLEETHVSLFDGSIAGIAMRGLPVSGVQFLPDTPPWRAACHPIFREFVASL